MGIDKDSLERLVPDEVDGHEATGAETLKLHLERYEFAARFLNTVKVKSLADCACGVGYGTEYLATSCQGLASLTGVDISKEAIDYATVRYKHPKISFVNRNVFEFGAGTTFDAITSLETIEHVPGPAKLIEHLAALVNRGGYLIASVPTTPSVDANPHHVNDFTERSFRKMFQAIGLRELACFRQVQAYSFFSVVSKTEKRTRDVRKNLPAYYLTRPSALLKRLKTTVVDGFNNKYITIIWQKD